jgi:anti-anti-sigma regulatory factor
MGGDDSQRLRDILAAGLGESPTRLIVDLAGVTSIARPALSALTAARRQGRSLGIDLVLRSPSEATVHEIDQAGLGGLLPVVDHHDDQPPRPFPTSWPAGSSGADGPRAVPAISISGRAGACPPAHVARRCYTRAAARLAVTSSKCLAHQSDPSTAGAGHQPLRHVGTWAGRHSVHVSCASSSVQLIGVAPFVEPCCYMVGQERHA